MKTFATLFISTLILILSANHSHAQLDTVHYIPPMHSAKGSGGIIFGGGTSLIKKHYIYLSTPSTTPFTVDIKRGDGTILASPVISNGSPFEYYVGTGTNTPLFVKKNQLNQVMTSKGIVCSGPEPFYMSYRVNGGANSNQAQHSDWATGKGMHGIGTSFRVGGMPCFNAGTNNGHPRSMTVGVMATQNNTTITVSDYDINIKLFDNAPFTPPPSFTIVLNAGETYTVCLKQNVPNPANFVGMIGSLITADKPIGMINGNLTGSIHPTNTQNQDFGIDISVPTNKIGQNYVMVEGLGSDTTERPMVVAHYDNTEIYVNGGVAPIATINAGDYYLIDNMYYQGVNHKNMYVFTSEPAYMYQMMAASQGNADGGMVLVPEINCFLPPAIDEIPAVDKIGTVSFNAGLTITTELGSTVLLNGTLLTNPEPVLGLLWETYKIDSNLVGDMEIISSSAVAVSVVGAESPSGFAGYFSGFVDDPDTSDFVAIDFCPDYTTSFSADYDNDFIPDSVSWNFGEISSGSANFALGDSVDHIYSVGGTYTVQMIIHRCTNDTVTKTITINPSSSMTVNQTICDGDSYTLPSGLIVMATGVYADTFATTYGCDSIITTDLYVAPVNTYNQTISLCYGSSYVLPSGTVATTTGIYNEVLTTTLGCDSIWVTDLTIEPLLTATIQDSICEGETYTLPSGLVIDQTGIYQDIISAVSGCDSVITIDFKVNPIPFIDAGADIEICPGESVSLNANNPNGATIVWSNNVVEATPFAVFNDVTYTVYAALNGCTSEDEVEVNLIEIPDASFTYSSGTAEAEGTEVSFYVNDPFNSDVTYFWSYGDGYYSSEYEENHLYFDGNATDYTIQLVVTNQLGCSDSMILSIEIFEPLVYYVPNAFTPNGDSYNNSFLPVFTSGYDPYDYHLTIFNRWGQILFESYNAEEGWDGTYADQLVEDGTYVWDIQFGELKSDKKHQEQGHITVLK
jgi:gliding motility-associated-like protein